MSVSTMTTTDLGLLARGDASLLKSMRIPLRVLARSFAALTILTALFAPDCCLTRSHVHSGDLDGLGPVCFSRAVWR
jgi:hypothetical protein